MILNTIKEHSNFLENSGMTNFTKWQLHRKFVEFIDLELNIGMLVPAKFFNGDWVILEEPNINDFKSSPFCESGDCKAYQDELKEYQEAKDRVLFEGFEYKNDKEYYLRGYVIDKQENIFFGLDSEKITIEEITNLSLVLTEKATKIIGLWKK